jgi:tetratricopeptide (TPR) repeat protein
MSKLRRGGSGQVSMGGRYRVLASVARRAPPILLPRATPSTPESLLAKGPLANPKIQAHIFSGTSLGAPGTARISPAQAHEAHRCAMEGVRLVAEGRAAQGVDLLKRSIELNPGAASSHHDLGVGLMAAGRAEQAVDAFAAALRLDSRLATAHDYLGYIFESQGQVDKAMASYQAAVALKPDLVDVQLRLGAFYRARRLRSEAAAAFRAAATATAGTVTARIAEARALEAAGAFDEALAAMRAVVEAHPEDADAHALLAILLGQAGLSAEAAACFERTAEMSPDNGAAWSGVALHRKFTPEDGPLIARMDAALARPNLAPRCRQSLHFALGKAHDDMGNYEAAMRNFDAGNRLRARLGRLNRDLLVRRIDRLIESTPPGYRDFQPDPGVQDATPILIVGMQRSGSTLTEQILSSHPKVAAGGELEFWGVRYTQQDDIWSIASSAEGTRRLADDYLATLRAFGRDAMRITDKMLSNFMLLGFIHRAFPNATLIHCRRHPIDTALSIFATDFETNVDFAAQRSDLVFFFRQYQRLMAHWRQVLPPDRLIEVDYEALVADPEPHTRRLVAASGLEWDDSCLAPHRNARPIQTASVWQARQPIYRTSVERWRRYEPWLGELRELAPEA